MISKLIAFAEAFKKYEGLRAFGYRTHAARELIVAWCELPMSVRNQVAHNTGAADAYYSCGALRASRWATDDAREYLESAYLELGTPLADSIVDLNRAPVAPEPASFVAPSIAEDA